MVGMAFKLLKIKILKRIGRHDAAESYLRKTVLNWSRKTLDIVGLNYEIYGKENIPKRNCLFVSNHQSMLDIPLIMDAVGSPLGFIAKKELSRVPIINSWTKEINCIYLDRDNAREAVHTINEGVEKLKKGISMVIFPEGTRAKDGVIKDFKKGSLKLATKSGVPVVPVTISGTNKAYEEAKTIKKAIVKIYFGKPIFMEGLDKVEMNNLAKRVQQEVSSKL